MHPHFPAALPPPARAAFATASRILSCVVTESILPAIFVPACSNDGILVGSAILLVPGASAPCELKHVFALLPLRHVPIFRPGSRTDIALLDPLDMLPYVYKAQGAGSNAEPSGPPAWEAELRRALAQVLDNATTVVITPFPDTLCLWNKFADAYGTVDAAVRDAISVELQSSIAWQQYAYEHIPPPPTFDSPSIAWEQCIVEGHPTHPMHKTRHTFPPIPNIQPGDYDWLHPLIYLVAVPRTSMHIHGAWDDLMAPFCAAAAANAGAPIDVPEDHILVPVHALQIANIREKFPEARVLPEKYHVDALAQQSLRSVIVPSAATAHTLKLAFGVRLTSAIRTISPSSAFFGPPFSSTIVPLLTYDRTLLVVLREHGSAWHTHPDANVAPHLAAIVRDACDENTRLGACSERVIVCTALVETAYGGEGEEVPLAQIVFGLDTQEKREAWFDTFVDLFFRAFLPPVLENGVAFEAHPQNTLARFDAETRALTGFAIRDMGGLRIHAPTLLASPQAQAQGLRSLDGVVALDHAVLADTLDDVHARLYHTLVHNHLQQLARVLRLHGDGAAWAIVRRRLAEHVPAGHPLRIMWLAPDAETLLTKSFMRMRLKNVYKEHVHAPFPNLIHYKGAERRDE